jgi:hypothetical protein
MGTAGCADPLLHPAEPVLARMLGARFPSESALPACLNVCPSNCVHYYREVFAMRVRSSDSPYSCRAALSHHVGFHGEVVSVNASDMHYSWHPLRSMAQADTEVVWLRPMPQVLIPFLLVPAMGGTPGDLAKVTFLHASHAD